MSTEEALGWQLASFQGWERGGGSAPQIQYETFLSVRIVALVLAACYSAASLLKMRAAPGVS